MSDSYDRYLGMNRPITRRDFMNGAAMVIGAAMLPTARAFGVANPGEPQNEPGYDPPIRQDCAAAIPVRSRLLTACATAPFGRAQASPSRATKHTIWWLSEEESAGWPPLISFVRKQETQLAFSFLRTTTTSEVTPSETNFILVDASPCSMAEPSRSIAQPRIAVKLPL